MATRKYGLAFPIQIDQSGNLEYPTIYESLESSVAIILSWVLNTRHFNNLFGSIIYYSLGKPHTDALRGSLKLYTVKAITTWEKRLTDINVDIEFTDTITRMDISARIKENQEIFNYSVLL